MDPITLLAELIKAFKREGYKIFHVVEGSTGVGILIYKDPNQDPDAMIHVTNDGWAYYINLDGKLRKVKFVEVKIENIKDLVYQIIQ